ncbi:MAG: phosphatase PAP2 family protein [Clostridia bacterium]|nr:phosphatase PAP2 family protein [Clostridia bacterium]
MKKARMTIVLGIGLVFAFAVWTLLVMSVDVRRVGVQATTVGFATLNVRFHSLTGVDMMLYNITDWLGLIPVAVCVFFAAVGLVQLVKRKSLKKVDTDIILLGAYYAVVIAGYLIFETIPINYRPVLINGMAEASYPSSTTLLVLSVMPTLTLQSDRRLRNIKAKKLIKAVSVFFAAFMLLGRLISGVHWLTDIIGAVLLSLGLFLIYKGAVLWSLEKSCKP